jgi:hypothetical protein
MVHESCSRFENILQNFSVTSSLMNKLEFESKIKSNFLICLFKYLHNSSSVDNNTELYAAICNDDNCGACFNISSNKYGTSISRAPKSQMFEIR